MIFVYLEFIIIIFINHYFQILHHTIYYFIQQMCIRDRCLMCSKNGYNWMFRSDKILCYKRFNTNQNDEKKLNSTLGDSPPLLSTVKQWAVKFKHDCSSICGNECSGHPKELYNWQTFKKFTKLCLNDWHMKWMSLIMWREPP